jgi:hypothetical protein
MDDSEVMADNLDADTAMARLTPKAAQKEADA